MRKYPVAKFLFFLGVVNLVACGRFEKETVTEPSNFSISENELYNSNFAFWQKREKNDAGPGAVVVRNSEQKHFADAWYVENQIGEDARVLYDRVAPSLDGSAAGAKVVLASNPTTLSENPVPHFSLSQTLTNRDSLRLYNQTVSFSVHVKAVGLATRVGVQLLYSTTENVASLPLGDEQFYDINPDSFTLVTIQGQQAGTRMTPEGVLGVRIRMLYAQNRLTVGTTDTKKGHGFIVEKAMLNVGPLNGTYRERSRSTSIELADIALLYRSLFRPYVRQNALDPRESAPVRPAAFASPTLSRNVLYNGAFDFWQRGTSLDLPNGKAAYLADRWMAVNEMGERAIVAYQRVPGTVEGSRYGLSLKVDQNPVKTPDRAELSLIQTLTNFDSRALFNRTASFSAYIRSLGKVSRVGIQFVYAQTEARATNPIGHERIIDIDPNNRRITLEGVALEQKAGNDGVIGIRIRLLQAEKLNQNDEQWRLKATREGNVWDANNGFVIEQAMVNVGDEALPFQTKGNTENEELHHCLYFYEKSFLLEQTPDFGIGEGRIHLAGNTNTESCTYSFRFVTPKRIDKPVLTLMNPFGKTGNCEFFRSDLANNTAPPSVTPIMIGRAGFDLMQESPKRISGTVEFQYTVDAEIY